jgi:hypothetical protein
MVGKLWCCAPGRTGRQTIHEALARGYRAIHIVVEQVEQLTPATAKLRGGRPEETGPYPERPAVGRSRLRADGQILAELRPSHATLILT